MFLMLYCFAACGGRQLVEFANDGGTAAPNSDGGIVDTDNDGIPDDGPQVTETLPVNNGSGVAINTTVSATFSKDMDAATINDLSFTVKQGTATVPGSVTYNAGQRTATFTPTTALGSTLEYTARVTPAAKDVFGLQLLNYQWAFTTSTAAPPTVTATTPPPDALNVSVSKRPTATFSKAMNPATINGSTFTLTQGGAPVAGTVTLDGLTNKATFTPATPLAVGLEYLATVTTGAKDTGNNPLVADTSWSFTTDACGQAPVALRSAASFVVLAGSTVTSTGPTSVTGDLGVSPGTAITGFPPGAIVGASYAGTPPAAQAIADLTTAYNDAAGRTLCAVTVAGNLGGQTLPPGLYKSTSSLEVSSSTLTLDAQGDDDAVFIFQMASTLTTTDGRQVILINGAKSANVFWQVGTSATLGTTSSFQGTIMADQAVTLNTGASLNGRALARIAAADLDSNTIVKPAP